VAGVGAPWLAMRQLAREGRDRKGEGERGPWLGARLGVRVPRGELLGELRPLLGCSVWYALYCYIRKKKGEVREEKRRREGKKEKKRKEKNGKNSRLGNFREEK
jgi:hypothetical protein